MDNCYTCSKPETILVAETLLTAAGFNPNTIQDAFKKNWVTYGTKGARTIQVAETDNGEYWFDLRIHEAAVYDREICNPQELYDLI